MPALADLGGAGPGPPAVDTGSRRRWADLRTRTLSAVLLGPAVLACIWVGGPSWAVLAAAAAVGLMVEWGGMCGIAAHRPATLALAAGGAASVILVLGQAAGLALAVLLVAGALSYIVSRRVPLAVGALYIGVPLLCLAALRGTDEAGRANLLFLVGIVWASDIGAYVTGRLFGGPKLAPAISPGKTWAGAAGGLVAAMLVGAALAAVLAPGPAGHAALAAAVLGVASQSGDLLESWIKRQFGVKDSGWLIPGHGGVLDRLDGLLAAAAAATLLMHTGAFGRGGVLWI